MAKISRDSVMEAVSLIGNYNEEAAKHVREVENRIDNLEDALGSYLLKLGSKNLSREDSHTVSVLLHSIGDIERISDLAVNILLGVEQMQVKEQNFSRKATEELNVYSTALEHIMDLTVSALEDNNREKAALVQPLEELMDVLNKEVKKRHVKRLRKGKCTIELGLSLSDIADTYERISDHCSNVAVCIIQAEDDEMEGHNYRREIKEADDAWFDARYNEFQQKYLLPE